jgi:hypothetical protein
MKRLALLPLACALIVGCQEQRSPLAVKPPSALLMDGAHAGNAHFFFLPPLVKQPSVSGVFNPALKPIVVICQLDVGPAPTNTPIGCTPGVAPISPGAVTADLAGQQYKVNWDTKLSAINPDKFYRIQVFGARGQSDPLGLADVDPVSNGSQLKNVNTGEYIGLVDGRTLPIKFRIERGAFGTNCTSDCAEANVSNAGGIVVTNTGFAGASFPSGWLPAGFDNVVVTIERVNLSQEELATCIPRVLPQAEGCYRFKTFPDVGDFALDVTAGMCVEVHATDARFDAAQLFSVEEDESEAVTPLRNTAATFVTCEGFASAGPGGTSGSLARRLLHRVGSWLSPSAAYAAHVGVGGLTGSFSRIGWVLPTTINFDVGPDGEGGTGPVPAGTIVNTRYSSEGVSFTRFRTVEGQSFCGTTDNVYANDHGPLAGGGFGFASGNNVVTVCPEGTSSDFSENEAGRIEAEFGGPASKVCINAYPTGFHGGIPGSMGFLEAFDSDHEPIQTATTPPGVAHVICVEAVGSEGSQIWSVQFAGSGDGLAIFDNLSVTFSEPISFVP